MGSVIDLHGFMNASDESDIFDCKIKWLHKQISVTDLSNRGRYRQIKKYANCRFALGLPSICNDFKIKSVLKGRNSLLIEIRSEDMIHLKHLKGIYWCEAERDFDLDLWIALICVRLDSKYTKRKIK